MTVFLQHWHLILLGIGITIIEAANTNQTHSGCKGPLEVREPNLFLKAVTVLNSDRVAQVFSHCIFKTSKDRGCTASLATSSLLDCFCGAAGGLLLGPPQSHFFRFKQAQLSQPLLICEVAQPPDPFGGHRLDLLPFVNVSCLAGPQTGCSLMSAK